MANFLAYIWRLTVVFTGFLAAAVAASLFFVLIGIFPLVKDTNAAAFATVLESLVTVLLLTLTVTSVASFLIAMPVFILIIFAEYFKWHGFLFHNFAGAILGFSATGLWHTSGSVEGESHLVLVGAAAGTIGASVYWLVAGRNAGKLFDQIVAAREQ